MFEYWALDQVCNLSLVEILEIWEKKQVVDFTDKFK